MKYTSTFKRIAFLLFIAVFIGYFFNWILKKPEPVFRQSPRIHDIQGKSHYSKYTGNRVKNVPGIVTLVCNYRNRRLGFFMQDFQPDNDSATSEGIYVVSPYKKVKAGDKVYVTGTVQEHRWRKNELYLTRIKSYYIKIVSSGNNLPASVELNAGDRMIPSMISDTNGFKIFNPKMRSIDFFESLEGMTVTINNPIVVGPTNMRYKEFNVLADFGKSYHNRTLQKGIYLRPGIFNSGIITLVMKYSPDSVPMLNTGDILKGKITGVLTYEFGQYRLLVSSGLPDIIRKNANRQITTLPDKKGVLRIATYNVKNCSPADTERIMRIGQDIVLNMGSPDIIALQEIQDNNGIEGGINDGELDAAKTYQAIIKAIKKAGGQDYHWADIAPASRGADGGIPGGNIRVGFIWRPDKISFTRAHGGTPNSSVQVNNIAGRAKLSFNPGRIEPAHPVFREKRKPLAGEFFYKGKKIFVIAVHLASKRDDDGLFGDIQPPVFKTEKLRTKQIHVVSEFVKSILSIESNANVVVLGDFNEYYFSESFKGLKNAGLTNLSERIPENSRYTYIHSGNSQALDHIFVSPSLLKKLSGVQILHINADFQEETRSSDHDPVLSAFHFDID